MCLDNIVFVPFPSHNYIERSPQIYILSNFSPKAYVIVVMIQCAMCRKIVNYEVLLWNSYCSRSPNFFFFFFCGTGSSYEMAAKCFASIEEYRLAADCISERARSKTLLGEEDLHSLFAASLLAKSAGLENHHGYLRYAMLDIATCSGRWRSVHLAAKKFASDLVYVR